MENYFASNQVNVENISSVLFSDSMNDESKMEVVKAFNNELVSLYDIKPPISKAKMTAITKAAMKSVKFYKHVVHGVEKFILKCRPDYKIPGLYVIDSIVRQSRHQFGIEKDVFAPRFSKNLLQTFKNICLCPEEDKQKLVRVINLWQKHKVFPEDLLKKFLVMVEASEEELPELYKDEIEAIQKSSKKSPTSSKKKKKSPVRSSFDNVSSSTPSQNSFYSNSTSRAMNFNENTTKTTVDPGFLQQLQTLTSLLQQSNVPTVGASPATNGTPSDQVKFDKKLLEYDYGEEEEEAGPAVSTANSSGAPADSLASIISNPDIMRQLQTLQVHLAQAQAKQPSDQSSFMDQQRMIQNHQMQAFNQALLQQQPSQPQLYPPVDSNVGFFNPASNTVSDGGIISNADEDDKPEIIMEKHGSDPLEVIDLDHIPTPPSERSPRRSYSRSRSRSGSRSRSRSRRNRRRSRSRSWNRGRSRDRDRNDDRRRRALPPIKRKHLAVCSTTLWVGHLSKLVQETDLSDTFGEFGDIVSIDLIPPRGCAFIQMNRRQDADRALHKLKNSKIQGKMITLAWAPGKGMKGREWKDYWEVDYGVSYIPWSKLSTDTDYDLLEDGGMLDQETMPDWLKNHLEEKRKISYSKSSASSKVLYTPSGTDMDESDNEDDDNAIQQSFVSTDMVLEAPNGVPEQMIPLPDGPQPSGEMPPLGIPLPPGQNPAVTQSGPLNLPPPNLLNQFLPPRFLGPMGVLGGNFMPPPLGVPPPVSGLLMPPQHMLNRLPPPFPGAPGLPMINPGSGQNSSLSQIPLPDTSSVNSPSSNDFKPPPFGMTPPLLFPGNPNMKLDLPGNPLPPQLGNTTETGDSPNIEKNKSSLIPSAFNNLLPFGGPNLNAVDKDNKIEDTDFRIMGDIPPPPSLMGSVDINSIIGDSNADQNKSVGGGGGGLPGSLDKSNFSRERGISDFEREHNSGGGYHRYNDRRDGSARNFDRGDRSFDRGDRSFDRGDRSFDRGDRSFDRGDRNFNRGDRDRENKYHYDRNHRFGGGRSPHRGDDGFDVAGNDRYKSERSGSDAFRHGNRFESRDYGRGGRDFRGGRGGRDLGNQSRPRGRSRERDYYRDGGGGGRRDYADGDTSKSRRFERRGRSRERSADDNRHNVKKSRWSENTSMNTALTDNWDDIPTPSAASLPPVNELQNADIPASIPVAPIISEDMWNEPPTVPQALMPTQMLSPMHVEMESESREEFDESASEHAVPNVQSCNESSADVCSYDEKQPPVADLLENVSQESFDNQKEKEHYQQSSPEAEFHSHDDSMELVDQQEHDHDERNNSSIIAQEFPVPSDQPENVPNEIPANEQSYDNATRDGGEDVRQCGEEVTNVDAPLFAHELQQQQQSDHEINDCKELSQNSGDSRCSIENNILRNEPIFHATDIQGEALDAAVTSSAVAFQSDSSAFPNFPEPRPLFADAHLPMMTRAVMGSSIGHFGPNLPTDGMFSPSFQPRSPRFQGHRPHPSQTFFHGPPPHLSTYIDSRPPQPFLSRSNNF